MGLAGGRDENEHAATADAVDLQVGSGNEMALAGEFEELIDGEGKDAEHEMSHDLGGAAQADEARAELVFESTEDALDHGAFAEAVLLGPGHLFSAKFCFDHKPRGIRVLAQRYLPLAGFAKPPGVIGNGPMAQLQAVRPNGARIVSRVHQIVEIRHARGRHGHQRNGDLGVMQTRSGEQRANRDLPVGHVQVQLVTTPVAQMAFAALFHSDPTAARQGPQLLRQSLPPLAFQTRAAFRCFGALGAALALLSDWLGFRIAFPRFNGGRVARDVSDEAPVLGFGDQRLVYALRQFGLGELGESAREGGFMRDLPYAVPSAQATQLPIAAQPLQNVARRLQAIHRFGQKSCGQGIPVFRRPPAPASATGQMPAQPYHAQHRH